MEEETGNWKNLHNEELHYVYFSPNVTGVIKIKEKMRWVGYTKRTGEKRYAYSIWWETRKEKHHLEYLGVDEKDNINITLKIGWQGWTGLI